jgi:predicted lipoprotein with Yx(FWY)xxD motif
VRCGLRTRAIVGAAAFIGSAVAATACGSNITTLTVPPTTDPSLTLTTQHSPVGPILATGGGATLYDFAPDSPTHSACLNDGCTFQWPPLLVRGPVLVGPGVRTALIGTLRRPDGSTQLSYGGHPLYAYATDGTPGVVLGQAIDQNGGLWYVLDPAGKPITTSFSVTPG